MARKKKFDYFESFTELTEKTIQEADLLIRACDEFGKPGSLENIMQEAHDIEHQGDIINHEIFKNIAVDFITPIDREDLLELSHYLDDIIDRIEEVIQQFYIYNVQEMLPQAKEFAVILKNACNALHDCTKELKNYKNSKDKIRELIVKVNDAEEDGDLLYMEGIRRLFTKPNINPQKVIV